MADKIRISISCEHKNVFFENYGIVLMADGLISKQAVLRTVEDMLEDLQARLQQDMKDA